MRFYGESFATFWAVFGLAGAGVGAAWFYDEFSRWGGNPFEHRADQAAGATAMFAIGALLAAWGLVRRVRPAAWIAIDRRAHTVTVKKGGRTTHPFHQLGQLDVRRVMINVRKGYAYRYQVHGSDIVLFESSSEEKARQQRETIERAMRHDGYR